MAELVLPKNSKVKDGKSILLIRIVKIKNISKYIVGILRKMIIQDMTYMRLISINGPMVLDALIKIKEIDSTLTFRRSCRRILWILCYEY